MTAKVGDRVGALRNRDGDKFYLFGFGVYEGKFDTETGEKKDPNNFWEGNPRIKLDDDRGYVWGFECWWGPEDAMRKAMDGHEVEVVDPKYRTATPLKPESTIS